MAGYAGIADMQEQSWSRSVPISFQDGRDFHTAPDSGMTRGWGSSFDKVLRRLPKDSASAHRRTCAMAVVPSDLCYEHMQTHRAQNRAGYRFSTRTCTHNGAGASPHFAGCAWRRDMVNHAEEANIQEQGWLQHMAMVTGIQDGRDFQTEPFKSCKTSISSVDKAIRPRNSARAGETSAMQQAHKLTSDGSMKEAEMRGSACFVRKHKPSTLGCAIVELGSQEMREKVMSRAEQFPVINGVPRMEIHGVFVNVRRHIDRYGTAKRQEKLTDIFISWSHDVEKQSPLPLKALVDAFDALIAQDEAPTPSSLPAPRFII